MFYVGCISGHLYFRVEIVKTQAIGLDDQPGEV